MYLYPNNLQEKATLWLWSLRDVSIAGVSALVSIFIIAQTGVLLPMVGSAVYAFLTIRFEGTCILDFIRYAVSFLMTQQQYYEWNQQ